jgi:2-oxoacid:acceptor oxidoreductase gamma subunit (pyruvate/2-ketoisovalerate family)
MKIEIRFHGRGGQGAVVASRILAVAFSYEGWHVQSFPAFGVERRGAPVLAFLRVGNERFHSRYQIYEPDHLVVLDPSLSEIVDVTAGLKRDGHILMNSKAGFSTGGKIDFKKAWINAYSIALEMRLGSATAPIVNTAMIGAFTGAWKLIEFHSLEKAIREEIPAKVEENIEAAGRAFQEVEVE